MPLSAFCQSSSIFSGLVLTILLRFKQCMPLHFILHWLLLSSWDVLWSTAHCEPFHSRWKVYRQKEIYVREQLEILNRASPVTNTKLYLNNQNGFENHTYSCLQFSESDVFLRSWSVLYCFLDNGQ